MFLTGVILGSLTHPVLSAQASVKPPVAGRATKGQLLYRSGQADGQDHYVWKVFRVYISVPMGPPDLPTLPLIMAAT